MFLALLVSRTSLTSIEKRRKKGRGGKEEEREEEGEEEEEEEEEQEEKEEEEKTGFLLEAEQPQPEGWGTRVRNARERQLCLARP